jgi:hypothetical protein
MNRLYDIDVTRLREHLLDNAGLCFFFPINTMLPALSSLESVVASPISTHHSSLLPPIRLSQSSQLRFGTR